VEITQGIIYSKITEATSEEIEKVNKCLSFKSPNYWFSPKYKSGVWDGYIRFLYNSKIFPAGLTSYVSGKLTDCDIQVNSYNFPDFSPRVTPTLLKTKQMGGEYQYQQEAIIRVLKGGRGILHLATGAGKTYIAAAIASIIKQPALFIVPGIDLMYQTKEVFERETDLSVGLLGGGKDIIDADIVIGVINTIYNRSKKKGKYRDWLEQVYLVFADECHLASAKQYSSVLQKCTSAVFRIGLSGTPLEHGDIRNMKLIGTLGPVIDTVRNTQLIELGVSARPIVHIHKIERTNTEPQSWKYPDIYDAHIVNNKYRNDKIVEIAKKGLDKGQTVIVLVQRIEHGESLYRLFKYTGVDAPFCYGDTDKQMRQDLLAHIKRNKGTILILSKIGEVGLDIPAIDVIIRGSGGKSSISTIQAIGRGLRKKENENVVYYHDFNDTLDEYTQEHSRLRIKDYKGEEFDIRE